MAHRIVLLIFGTTVFASSSAHREFAVYFAGSAAKDVAGRIVKLYYGSHEVDLELIHGEALSAAVDLGLNRDAAGAALLVAEKAIQEASLSPQMFADRFVNAYRASMKVLVATEAASPDALTRRFTEST